MNNLKIYINGKFVPENKALISIFDRGFLFGDGAFETMRAYNGKVFKLEEHIERLLNTLKVLEIRPPVQLLQLSQLLNYLLKRNHLKNAYIRLGITRGASGGGFEIVKGIKPTFYIITKPFRPYPESWYKKGVKVSIVSIRKASSLTQNSELKTHNFLANVLARIEARKKGAFEGIMLDEKGYVCEGAVSNVFMVKNNMLLTPPLENYILPGITRKTVIEVAKKIGIIVKEENFKAQSLLESDECFLTNSLIEILPVRMINSFKTGNGGTDAITKRIISAYKSLIYR